MAEKKIKVKVDVETNTDASIAKLKELKKQLKETAVGSADFKKLSAQIRDVEDAIEGAKLGADDFAGALEAAPGPVGQLFQGLKKVEIATKSWGAALKATGIGLIVAAVGGLVAAFTQTEGAMKKLEPLLIGLEKILGGIFEAFQPVLDAFLELALKALPYITNGIKIFYSSLFALFTLVKEGGAGIGKILKGIFTLDTKSIEEGFNQLKGSWSKTVDSYNATSERFEAGTKKLTKTEKENQKERNDNAQKALDEKIKRLEAEDKLDEARLEKLKQEALAVAKTEQQKLDVETAFAQKAYDLRLKDLNDRQALYKQDSNEYKNLEAEKIKLQSDFLSQMIGFGEKQKEITDKTNKELLDAETSALQLRKAKGEITEKEYQQALFNIKKDAAIQNELLTNESLQKEQQDLGVAYATGEITLQQYTDRKNEIEAAALQKNKEYIDAEIALETYKTEQKKKLAEEERGIVANRLQAEFEDLDRKSKLADADFEQDLARIQEQRLILGEQEKNDLANTELTEFQKTEIRKKYADQRIALNTLEVDTEKAAMQAKHDINMAYLGLFEQFGNLLGQLAGKNKALAIAGIVISQAASIGQIIANTGIANAKAVAANPLGFGQPWVTINTISAALSIAATIASAVKSIQQINSAASQAGVSGGGGGSVGSAPQIATPKVGGTAAPQIQTGEGINPSQQIGQTISAASKPVRAYVVSGDISSQQALDRRTNRAATFAGG
jgi:hypothetical protein